MRVFERRPVFFCLFAPQNSPSVLRIHAALRADNCGASQKKQPQKSVCINYPCESQGGIIAEQGSRLPLGLIYNKTSFEY